jgi:hypothetical protein
MSPCISFVVGARGPGAYTCATPDALPRARDLRVLDAGSSLEAGPITCVARSEPALSCENERGGGFVLRPEDSEPSAIRLRQLEHVETNRCARHPDAITQLRREPVTDEHVERFADARDVR